MKQHLIARALYDAIVNFNDSEEAQDYYYQVMETEIDKKDAEGKQETVRDQVLRVYAMLFGDEFGLEAGQKASLEVVEATADRLYVGGVGFDPRHWYRMQHHFPVIDEDNYERFAALVISDLSAGPLHEAVKDGGDMLLVGEADPFQMTKEERQSQKVRSISLDFGGGAEE